MAFVQQVSRVRQRPEIVIRGAPELLDVEAEAVQDSGLRLVRLHHPALESALPAVEPQDLLGACVWTRQELLPNPAIPARVVEGHLDDRRGLGPEPARRMDRQGHRVMIRVAALVGRRQH